MIYSIGQLSKLAQCKIPTIRYYEEIGILDKATRSTGNQRQYTQAHCERLNLICHSRALGFSLKEIKQLIKLQNGQFDSGQKSHSIVQSHLTDVRNKIAKLKELELQLLTLVEQCHQSETSDCLCVSALK
ncbi:MerR family transcriptional regulator [Psychromonas sp. 14N.309.X.WAT.B.A12]|uniref:MerR family transcriptional regulator n=1 Tax=unclassified Psychromonas TaxID=2614957 RepID=UPI0025B12A6D|nr:MerR family transcriptional regulator [Psychromonas sp. 14N.309.X.WAT.B.A12]MDN2662406.1 MerR family transcriptional regulator [Psychromonas sp. 14N.309.X.WAT.B.A12]